MSKGLLPAPTAYLVLGRGELLSNDSVKTWFSGQGEVIQMSHGRIVKTAGLSVNWRAVRFKNLPAWKSLSDSPIQYQRERDIMPGYYYGITDNVTIKKISPPKNTLLEKIPPEQLTWFKEISHSPISSMQIPPARYALDTKGSHPRIVYSEQCIAKNLCFAFQEWSK